MSSLGIDSSALRYLARNGLYDISRAGNGIALSSDPLVALQDGSPLHTGMHGQEYQAAVKSYLTDLNGLKKSGASDAALLRQVGRIEQSLASRLQGGNLWLNNADAALRKVGPYK